MTLKKCLSAEGKYFNSSTGRLILLVKVVLLTFNDSHFIEYTFVQLSVGSLPISLSLSFSLSLTHTRARAHTRKHAHTYTHAQREQLRTAAAKKTNYGVCQELNKYFQYVSTAFNNLVVGTQSADNRRRSSRQSHDLTASMSAVKANVSWLLLPPTTSRRLSSPGHRPPLHGLSSPGHLSCLRSITQGHSPAKRLTFTLMTSLISIKLSNVVEVSSYM